MSSATANAVAFACLCWAAIPPVDAAEIRTWSDTTGAFKREAAFDRVDGETVVLKTSGGDEFTVPLARLSAADQAYVRKTAASQTADDPFQPSAARSGTAVNAQQASTSGGDVRIVVARGVGKTIE